MAEKRARWTGQQAHWHSCSSGRWDLFGCGARSPLSLGSLTGLSPSPSANPTVSHPRSRVRHCVCTLKPQALLFAMLPAPVEPVKNCACTSAPDVSLSLFGCVPSLEQSSTQTNKTPKGTSSGAYSCPPSAWTIHHSSFRSFAFLSSMCTPTPLLVVRSLDGGAALLYYVADRCSLPLCIPSLCIYSCAQCASVALSRCCSAHGHSYPLSLPSSLVFCLHLCLFLSCSCVTQSRSAPSCDHGCSSICGRVHLLEAALARHGRIQVPATWGSGGTSTGSTESRCLAVPVCAPRRASVLHDGSRGS